MLTYYTGSSSILWPVYSDYEILKALVGFPTISSDSNLDLIRFIEAYLEEFGIVSERIENSDNTKSNLFVTIGPKDANLFVPQTT